MDGDDEGQAVMLPRLGYHLRLWGHGHWCSSEEPHDQCFCICGLPAPYDEPLPDSCRPPTGPQLEDSPPDQ